MKKATKRKQPEQASSTPERPYLLKINSRGNVTLPKPLRQSAGMEEESYVLAKATQEGILIQPSASIAIEIYSKERIAEFEKLNREELGRFKL